MEYQSQCQMQDMYMYCVYVSWLQSVAVAMAASCLSRKLATPLANQKVLYLASHVKMAWNPLMVIIIRMQLRACICMPGQARAQS